MPKRILSFTILLFFLSSCNLPAGGNPTPTMDLVATQVAAILTSQPTVPPLPSDTPVPTDQPAQPTLPAETPGTTPTSSPEPSFTPTTLSDDPRQVLGNPTFVDTLDNGRSFGLQDKSYDDDYTFIRVENGALVLTSRYAIGYRGWRTGGAKIGNAYLETLVRTGECNGLDTYGLVFRSSDFVNGYWFQLTCDGKWAFGYWDGQQYVNLAEGGNVNDAIRTGSNQTNRIGVYAVGSNYTLYVNGVKIREISDNTFTEPGSYGIVIAARNTPNFTVYAEEFAIWKLD
ncbi:hypothetical protein BECAL_02412 [Bellilinea caldifistulae]|nr:family 16 glycoside hydrolase [Bellilinea caldifistulae]GAP11226.1 hypothetical protein BECAL_02412 [Bellilinea caldifistulae]